MINPIKNKYCSDKDLVIPGKCKCCDKCWIYVEPSHKFGRCVFGGPFYGYINMEDNTEKKIKK